MKPKKAKPAKAKTKKGPTAKAKTKKNTTSKVKASPKAKAKTKKKGERTHIIAIIDKSGSMNKVAKDAIGGFNQFLGDQKKLNGKATMNVVLFSSADNITPLYNDRILDIKDVQELTTETYVPDGSTALNDAIVQSMTSFKLKENNMKPSQKPHKVLVIIVTDGDENASREYPKSKVDEVKKLITMRKEQNWQFVFLCSTEDTALTGESLGISRGNTFQFTNDAVGNNVMYSTLSMATASFRNASTKSKSFSKLSNNLLAEDDVVDTKASISIDDADADGNISI